jgi:tRNA modification GTPase
VLEALIAAGARVAGPGEFTLRAFLHGRLDLAQAEAVADLIHAETDGAHALALAQLAGALSRAVRALCERVADATAEVEARVDFAEDVGGIEVPGHVRDAIAHASRELEALLASAPFARAVRDGVRVPLVGRPNAGKSSLFNALLGEERAIVTPVPGTTRDRVSESLEIAGVRVNLSDTAGLREAADAVEAIGVERTRAALEDSQVAVWVVDGAVPLDDGDAATARRLAGRRVVAALNKADLPARVDAPGIASLIGDARVVRVSALQGTGIGDLRDAIAGALGANGHRGDLSRALANPRHVDALARARAALARASDAACDGAAGELVALELREALGALGEVTGETVGEDLLDRIFARFCIGK